MSRQYFEDMTIEPLAGANTIVSSTGAAIVAPVETALFPVAQILIPAGDVRPGKIWKLTAGGIWTNATTGTLTITPRWGTTTSGTSLGASAAQTVLGTSVAAAPWFMTAIMICRSTSWNTGANANVICTGHFASSGIAATAGSSFHQTFGGTATSVDPLISGGAGFFIGWTLSVAGTVSPQWQLLQSLN